MPIISNFPCSGNTSGGSWALAAVTNIETMVASGKVYVKWTDPNDLVTDEEQLAMWAGTLLVRKAGSMPTSQRDGTIVLDSTVRNQYSETYFCDSGLSNDTVYYYKFFPYSTAATYTDSTDNEFTAMPTAQVAGIDEWLVTSMSATTEAGNGKIDVKWTDPSSTIVLNDITLATWGGTTVVVKAGSYATSKDDEGAAYRLKVTTRNLYSSSPLTVTGLTNGTTYFISFFPETTDGGVNSNTAQRTTGVANRITISTKPTQSNSLTYNGGTQYPTWNNYSSSLMTLSGVTSASNAGSYAAVFTPNSDYRWSDGSTSASSIVWTIAKAAGSFSLSATSVSLNDNATSTTVSVTRSGDGEITAVSADTGIASVSVSGTNIVITATDDTIGNTTTITVSVAAGTNHTSPADQIITVTYTEASSASTVLDECSWSDISAVSAAGQGANYWAVGDCKGVTISGTVGTQSVSGTYYVYILGFDHNGASNTIDFGTFKTSASGGTDICLVDSVYNSKSSDGTRYFNLNHWGSSSSPYNTNYGGWKGCDARYDVLGSTDSAPSGYGSTPTTSRTGYDASATCATNPVSNTLMAALPADLRAVMKPMTIYTDNIGAATNTAACVTTSVDYLPLLAEFEIFGTRSYANSYEQNYQKQYAYFSAGNSKIKYKHGDTATAAYWWERSPGCSNGICFCIVNAGGNASNTGSRRSCGLAPAFRV